MVVWCPDWALVAAGVDLSVPAVVLHANRVTATTPAARAEGVRVGLRRREAQSRCPEVELVDHDPARDARAFEAVAGAVEAVTPRVELTRPGVCSFPTRGPSRYFGGDEALARRVAGLVADAIAGPSRVGVADGPFAALLAARRGLVVPPGATPAFLAPFPVEALEDEALTDVLTRLGIATLADLAALPRPDLVARFGWPGERAHRLASGDDARLPDTRPPPPDLVARVELDPPAERVDAAAFVAKRLADDLHERLAATGLVLCPGPGHAPRPSTARSTSAAGATRGPSPPRPWPSGCAGNWRVGSTAAPPAVPPAGSPSSAWSPSRWGRPAAVSSASGAARRRRRNGPAGPWPGWTASWARGRPPSPSGGAGAARPRPSPWSRPTPWTSPSAPWSPTPPSPPGPVACPPRLPARVLATPVRAEVVDRHDRPVGVSGRGLATAAPARVRIGTGADQAVAGWAGPWPVDERWWDTANHRRRARFQVLTAEGTALLLSVEEGRWWLEATYD